MFDLDLALRFGAALGLGLLLGLERERKRDAELMFGGVRTFALIALLGAVGAFIERELDQGWLIIAAFVAISALVIVSYATTAARGELGITTEITALLAFIQSLGTRWSILCHRTGRIRSVQATSSGLATWPALTYKIP